MAESIIDNVDVKMHDLLTRYCDGADTLDIAVGYFHVSGFNELRRSLTDVKKIRLIMGNETDYLTAEHLRKGHDPYEVMRERIVDILNDTPDSETSDTLLQLYEYIKSGKMEVRLHVHSKFHAKAYILKDTNRGRADNTAFIGSSNLSRRGLGYEGGNIELNLMVRDDLRLDALSKWYESIWDNSDEYKDELIKLMESTEPYARRQNDKEYVTPRELFKIMANELLDANVESDDDMLAEFQKIGVINAQDKIQKYGGVIISDSVGLGKTFMGMRLIQYAQADGKNVLIIVPKSVESNWWREIGLFTNINQNKERLRIMSIEKLSRFDLARDSGGKEWKDLHKYDYVVVDEAHNFKNHGLYADGAYEGTKNYANITELMANREVPCVLLTATPLSNNVSDLKNLIDIFTNEGKLKNYNSDLDFSHFDRYKKLDTQIQKIRNAKSGDVVYTSLPVQDEIEKLKQQQQQHIDGIVKILEEVMILRTRSDIGSRYPNLLINGKPITFQQTTLRHKRCEFPDEYIPLYRGATELLGRLILPHITMREDTTHQSHHLYLMLLYQRLDSSIHSFVTSIERRLENNRKLLNLTRRVGWRNAVESVDEDDLGLDEYIPPPNDGGFHSDEEVTSALSHDIELLEEFIHTNVDPVRIRTARYMDPKVKLLQKILDESPGKVLVFTQYVDTAKYLYDMISVCGIKDCATGQGGVGTDKDNDMKVNLFAPIANGYTLGQDEREIDVLITTNTLAEGVNLQDCRIAINYDIPWNPMKIVQRVGRIDRIGSNTRATVFNILPDRRFDQYFLNLMATVSRKVATISSILGNENPILTNKENVTPKSIGETIIKIGEADSVDEYERMTRNRVFKSVHAREDRSVVVLKIKEIVKKLGLVKTDFREYERSMYCMVKARDTDTKGVFAMFRIYDGRKRDKIRTVTIFRNNNGVCSEISDGDFLDFIPMHKHTSGHRRTSEMDKPLAEIKTYFEKHHYEPTVAKFRRSKMGTRQSAPKVQEYVKQRLDRIENSESFGNAVEVSDLRKKFLGIILRESEVSRLESLFGKQGLKTEISRIDRDEFIETISEFYERHVQNNPHYVTQRSKKDIERKCVCWGAFI